MLITITEVYSRRAMFKETRFSDKKAVFAVLFGIFLTLNATALAQLQAKNYKSGEFLPVFAIFAAEVNHTLLPRAVLYT
jgi:hypothetical protein